MTSFQFKRNNADNSRYDTITIKLARKNIGEIARVNDRGITHIEYKISFTVKTPDNNWRWATLTKRFSSFDEAKDYLKNPDFISSFDNKILPIIHYLN